MSPRVVEDLAALWPEPGAPGLDDAEPGRVGHKLS
jgi:hypothetical protein